MPIPEKKLITGSDLLHALSLLSRIPAPWTLLSRAPTTDRSIAASVWAWPLIGALIGFLAGLVGIFALAFGAVPGVVAGLILATMMLLTGGLHEDGLADTFDGLWGGHDVERRLEIMKDSRVGSYGVLALCLSVLVRWSALVVLVQSGWILAPLMAVGILSRTPMAVLLASLPNARGTGLAKQTGTPEHNSVVLMLGIAAVFGLVLIGANTIPVAFWIAIVTIGLAGVAKAKIGGQTGDILGASQQFGEIAALSVLAASLT